MPHNFYMFMKTIPAIPKIPLSHRLATLLMSWEVQSISFTFGSVKVMPDGFRAVAQALIDGDIRISTDAAELPADALGGYRKDLNVMYFKTDLILDSVLGRGVAVHECAHALADARGRNTAIRSEESSALLAEAWYVRNAPGMSAIPADMPEPIWKIGRDIANRAATKGRPVRVTGSEIVTCRSEVAKIPGDHYPNGHITNDGV